MVQNSPSVMGALQKNILERISLMAQEQIQLEFREELMTSKTNADDVTTTIHRTSTNRQQANALTIR